MFITVEKCLLIILISAAFITDLRSMRIPNVITISGLLAGIAFHAMREGWTGLMFSGAGFIVGFTLVLLLHVIGALGAGDVKLFAAIGALSGTDFVLYCLMYSILYAGAVGAVIVLFRKMLLARVVRLFCGLIGFLWLKDLKGLIYIKDQANLRFPFMYAVVPAAITTWYLPI